MTGRVLAAVGVEEWSVKTSWERRLQGLTGR